MGQGLSKNSPVQLSLNKSNYEALISRHGQWIRWRSSFKCSCVSMPSMQPDPKCKICKGRGVTYTHQKSQVVHSMSCLYNNYGILDVEKDYQNCELIEVYDYNGRRYKDAVKNGQYIQLNDTDVKKGTYFNIVLREDNEKVLDVCIANSEDMGFYSIPGITSRRPNVEGVYYEAQPDIIAIESIVDANGVSYEAKEFRLNKFLIEPKTEVIVDEENGEENEVEIPIAEPLVVKGVHYVPPFIFAVLQQNLSKGDAEVLTEMKGDAVCLFPYNCDVAEDDILTVMAGSFVNKEVLPRSDYETDTLANYFVYDIISITGINNDKIINYEEGKDYVLVGTNKIKWLEESDNIPDVGDAYSVTYHVLPTYKVVKEIPQLRTSENQRFPKKAVIKLFATYSDATGANTQSVKRKPTNGSY